MYINLKSLIHLPVYTESGTHLGKVNDAEFDVEAHHVRHYVVGSGLLKKDDYSITPSQVKSITTEKMIVEDAVHKISDTNTSRVTSSAPILGGVSASQQE